MESRKKRQLIIASLVAASLLVVAAIGTTAFFVNRNQQRADDVAEASRVAARFHQEVSAYRAAVQSTLTSRATYDAENVKIRFDAALDKATPELGDAPAWGKTHSATYRAAVKAEKTLKDPYEDVSTVLEEAVAGQPFIAAAKVALKIKIDDYVGTSTRFSSGAPFRDKLIPGFEKALATFEQVKVPAGQEQIASDVVAALEAVIRDARKAAAQLDSGRGAGISAITEYYTANSAVTEYQQSLESRLEAAIKQAAAEVSGGAAGSAT